MRRVGPAAAYSLLAPLSLHACAAARSFLPTYPFPYASKERGRPRGSSVSSHKLVLAIGHGSCGGWVLPQPARCWRHSHIPLASLPGPSSQPATSHMNPRRGTVLGAAQSALSVPSRALPAGTTRVLQEDAAIQRAADALLAAVPNDMLFRTPSVVSLEERLATRRDSLLSFDAGTIKKAQSTLLLWLAFCERHQLPDHGAPFDAELCLWFLREEDQAARNRAKGKRSGATVKHSLACSLRWMRSTLLIPFDADLQPVRKASRVDRSSEPAWSPMWPVGTLLHLLRLALSPHSASSPFVRAYAAGAYLMCAASLRQVDGLRSLTPKLVEVAGIACFHSTAALSKGRRRARMQPLPWWVPTTSPTSAFSESDVRTGLSVALQLIPAQCGSMFPSLLDARSRETSLSHAVRWGNEAAAPHRLAISLADILQLPPLELPPAAARALGQRKHGPRHTMPELARVSGMAAAAREEIGRWRSSRGRLNTLSNRYSRDSERVLQCRLRAQLLSWIAQCAGADLHAPLECFVASQSELDDATSSSLTCLQQSMPVTPGPVPALMQPTISVPTTVRAGGVR